MVKAQFEAARAEEWNVGGGYGMCLYVISTSPSHPTYLILGFFFFVS